MASAALHVYISPMLFFELLIVVALILLNGVLAMAELAVVSSRRARLQALVNREVVGARRALALASDPGRFLSTVQIGITLNGVLSGAFSGATLGQRLVQWFVAVGLSPAIAEIVGVGLVVAAITYVSLIVGELVPKQIALREPERVAVRLAPEKIRVNAVCPGPIDTPMLRVFVARPDQKSTAGMDPEDLVRRRAAGAVPLGRTGRPEEIANAALFLLSDEASFITGAALPVDGGVTAA